MWNKIKPYVISIAIALSVGALSALFTKNSMNIYADIVTPPLAPPGWVFPVVWTILYVLMGISSAMVYTKYTKQPRIKKTGLGVYALSLAVNFFWSIIFFNQRAFLFSLLWLILLWVLILVTILRYRKISKIAAYLQIPYLIWVTFALYLNYMIYILN